MYIIDKVFKPKNDYSVYEYKVENLDERLMEEDIQKISYPIMNVTNQPKFFKISKLVKAVTKDNLPHYEVAWVGFRGKNTIEPRENLMADVPKMINAFEKKSGIEFKTDKNGKVYVYTPPSD